MTEQCSVYTIEEVAKMLGLSRTKAYEAAARGELPVLKFGRRIVVPKKAFERMLESAVVKKEISDD